MSNGLYEDVSVASIEDGTSNTVFVSECVITPDYNSGTGTVVQSVRGGVAQTSNSTVWSTAYVNECLSKRSSDTGLLNAVPSLVGGRFADAYNAYTAFNTILPPNSPSCFNSASANENVMMSANSYHSGGVNCGMGDGSVRFVSDTVNALSSGVSITNVDVRLVPGDSPFGVWGALGSRSGSESRGL